MNHAAPQVRPIPIAARMRRHQFSITTSRRSIGRGFRVLVEEGQVLCNAEYLWGRRRSRSGPPQRSGGSTLRRTSAREQSRLSIYERLGAHGLTSVAADKATK